MEIISNSIKGIYRDILKGPDGHVIHDSGWVSNTIVDSCRMLLAAFMKNEENEKPEGIQYLAVGKGKEEWDTEGTDPPEPGTSGLENRYEPTLADLELVYLNESDGPSQEGSPTSQLQITATLKPGYPAPEEPLQTYPLREFGLFGRFGGVDYMIDCIRHPVIHKDVSATLIRVVRLYF